MFTDWVTVSFGAIDRYEVKDLIYNHLNALQKSYPRAFTRQTFGTLSVCLPGQFWQGIEEHSGHTLVDDVCHWCSTAHVSRFDLAHDWNLEQFDAQLVWNALSLLPNVTRLESPSGRTWYVGNRESDRFVRCYDKRAEIKARTGVDIGFPVLRFEFESKGRVAEEYFSHHRRAPEQVVGDIGRRYGISDHLGGDPAGVIRVHGLPKPDPFAFIHQFRAAIRRARLADPKLFDELIPPPCP